MCYFPPPPPPPASRLEAAEFFHLNESLCWQKHNWGNMNETEAFFTQLCDTIPIIVPQSCVMNALVSFMLSSFSKWGQLCFCQHNGTPSEEKIPATSRPACGGKSSTFWKWHCLSSPRIKTPYPYLINLVSNYLEKNILSNTVKINGIQFRWIRIKVVAFFLGHIVI